MNKVFDSFTRDYCDNSMEAGFEFIFYCDLCHFGYRTPFMEADACKRSGILRRLFYKVSCFINLIKRIPFNSYSGQNAEKTCKRFSKFAPEWHCEHELALEHAQNEARKHFNRCSKCFRWVCDNDFNIDEGKCFRCAPVFTKLK